MNRISLVILILTITMSTVFAQNSDSIIGRYRLPNKLDVEIYKVGNKYNGKIIALNDYEDGQKIDYKNPDESKQNTPLIGMEIIKGLEYDAEDGEWVNGEMYGPEKGMNFDLKVTEMREKEIQVVGSKYIFWHTLIWQKI